MGGGGELVSSLFGRYGADGSGRDTYIRRDPQECFGKQMYKPEVRLVTRFGTSGQTLARDQSTGYQGFEHNKHDNVGGAGGVTERPARYLQPVPAGLTDAKGEPFKLTPYVTIKELVQDRKVQKENSSRAGVPLPRGHVGGYSGFQPRVPPADTAEWVRVTSLSDDPAYMPPDPAVAGRATFN